MTTKIKAVGTVGALAFLLTLTITTTAVPPAPWQQVASGGLGDPLAEEISAVAAFDGYLYAGTANPTNDACIFRAADGAAWQPVTDPGFGSDHDTAPRAILDMLVYNGRLYASTGRGNAAQIWRTVDGLNWARVVNAGFGDPDVTDISVLTAYNGQLYAGATSAVAGAQIWRSYTGDSNSWTQVASATAGSGADQVTGMAVFNGALYAAIQFESEAPVAVWRSYGGAWSTIVDNGFGDRNTILSGGMAVFGNYLYVGAGNNTSGAQLWRTADGATWAQVAPSPGFGDGNNTAVTAVTVFQNMLYVGISNGSSGLEVWRSANGTTWTQDNGDGFGSAGNTATNDNGATAVFGNQLYLGTANTAAGGELWRRQAPYGVALAADQAQSGAPGQAVTYTLTVTNSGAMTDTYDLATNATWPTAVSVPTMTLNPGSSGGFSVTVTIPLAAAHNAADLAAVTATSQGDTAVMASAALTTTCVNLPEKVYLPLVLKAP